MKTENKPVYYCDFCKKHGLSKHKMEYHELICFRNPVNKRSCTGCCNLIKKQTTAYYDAFHGGSEERNVELFYCKAKEIFIYPPKTEIKKNFFDIEEENEPMPKECDLFTNDILF